MAIRKDPARRYQSVGQFSADIQRHLDGLPVIARQDTVAYRTSKFIQRHPFGVAAVILILLSLIGGIVISVRQGRAAEREKVKAEAINNFLQTMLGASNPGSKLRQQKADLRVKDVLDEASKRLGGEELSHQPEVKAELQRIIGVDLSRSGAIRFGWAESGCRAFRPNQNLWRRESGNAQNPGHDGRALDN